LIHLYGQRHITVSPLFKSSIHKNMAWNLPERSKHVFIRNSFTFEFSDQSLASLLEFKMIIGHTAAQSMKI
jgi:hypothetical protein